ncbi:thermonuclease family protein [Methylobacterium gossipiicola]|uniref:Endonuclease YncB, thermonuclease family n=1 Tax=Methylobacterium gossipiicola TaxID=582675 RepID=A0A1I2UVQ8_9HYPH|nr:thermonuclease family protein [Methylobacterium gossipiicola]SFG79907.1 Endonuclease YncB, thermonuclease family [Methylobacterium gossipiicola]
MTKKLLKGLALFALFCGPVRAETVDGASFRVVDGDTVDLAGERIRLIEPDAPEISKPRCNAELAKGLRASGRLRQLLKGPVEIERSGRTDRYGRTLASLIAPQGNVATILISEGLAVLYRPGFEAYQQRAAHWCPE